MSDPATNADRLLGLAGSVCDEIAIESDLVELDGILLADEPSRNRYLDYCWIDVAIKLELRAEAAARKADQQRNVESAAPLGVVPVTIPGTMGHFSLDWCIAYLIATVICGVSMLIGSVVRVSEPVQVARRSSLPSRADAGAKTEFVGRITGMVDCKWADQATEAFPGAPVPLGCKYSLASGLMEITYDTGAKVILQGPATYEVESAAGGYLLVGKLTARLEKKNDECGMMNDELRTGASDIHHSSFLTHPLFAVRTPTAAVTDLGTEFGVEVDKKGNTTSHVFRGSVRVQTMVAGGKTGADAQVLCENQSVRVERRDGSRQIVALPTFTPSHFVRELPKRTVRTLDLVDVVAGGDGCSGRRNRGIDITNGRPTDTPWTKAASFTGEGRYRRVEGLPLVDGVFVPDGRTGGVQLDSAGHVFDGFPESPSLTGFHVWAGGVIPVPTTFIGPTKDSADFTYKYEMDSLPTDQDLDGNGVPDMGKSESAPGNIGVSGGVMTILGSSGSTDYVGSTAAGQIWQANFASGDYTIEFSAKVLSTVAGTSGQQGAFSLYSGTGYYDAVSLAGSATTAASGTGTAILSTDDNMDAFHTFRLARQGMAYYVWRDGKLIGDRLITPASPNKDLLFGDGGGWINGSTAVDYFRLQPGAYAPAPKPSGLVLPGSPDSKHMRLVSAKLAGLDYSSAGHGVLWLHGNKGITFDLEAIRRVNPGCRLMRFHAVAGVTENDPTADHLADVWVFVDGRVGFRRREINRYSGAMPVVVPIGESDRFLTLAATGGGDNRQWDWIVFGDPRIELFSSLP